MQLCFTLPSHFPLLPLPLTPKPGAFIYLLHLVSAHITCFLNSFWSLYCMQHVLLPRPFVCPRHLHLFLSVHRQLACVLALDKRFKIFFGMPLAPVDTFLTDVGERLKRAHPKGEGE